MYQPIKFFLFALAFMGLLTSCQKEQETTQKSALSRAEVNKKVEELRKKDLEQIGHFVEKLKAAKSNSSVSGRDEPLTIEEATFGTEAVLNMYYTRPDNRFNDIDKSQSVVTVPISNGHVSDADMLAAYYEVGQKALDHLDAASFPNKKLVYVDVVIANKTATEATLDVKTAVGEKLGTTTLAPPYFDEGWRCGAGVFNDAGLEQVGDFEYENDDKDAAKLFTSTLNTHFREDHPFEELPYYGWYVYDVTSDFDVVLGVANDGFPQPNPDPNDIVDNSKDFLFYRIEETNVMYDEQKYIDMDEMNFYYAGLEATIATIEDPVWQAEHADDYGFSFDHGYGNMTFVGNKVARVDIQALELEQGISTTQHYPNFVFERVFILWGMPSHDDGDLDEAIATVEHLTP